MRPLGPRQRTWLLVAQQEAWALAYLHAFCSKSYRDDAERPRINVRIQSSPYYRRETLNLGNQYFLQWMVRMSIYPLLQRDILSLSSKGAHHTNLLENVEKKTVSVSVSGHTDTQKIHIENYLQYYLDMYTANQISFIYRILNTLPIKCCWYSIEFY